MARVSLYDNNFARKFRRRQKVKRIKKDLRKGEKKKKTESTSKPNRLYSPPRSHTLVFLF